MDTRHILGMIARGNYGHPDGLNALDLGTVSQPMMANLLAAAGMLIRGHTASRVEEGTHSTGWTLPSGDILQWSLFNAHGHTNLTVDDFEYGDLRAKRVADLPGLRALAAELPGLVNLRMNLMGPDSSLSPHKERLERPMADGTVALRGRFHLPLRTTKKAFMLAAGDVMNFQAGHVYFFNNGSVHAAENGAKTDRIHLVWDQLLTVAAMDTMFGGTPPSWLTPDPQPAAAVRRMEVERWEEEPAQLTEQEFYSRELVFHP